MLGLGPGKMRGCRFAVLVLALLERNSKETLSRIFCSLFSLFLTLKILKACLSAYNDRGIRPRLQRRVGLLGVSEGAQARFLKAEWTIKQEGRTSASFAGDCFGSSFCSLQCHTSTKLKVCNSEGSCFVALSYQSGTSSKLP